MKKKRNIINHLIPAIVFLMIAFALMLILYFSTEDWKGSQAGLQLSVLSFTLISIFDLGFAIYDLHKQKQDGEEKTEVSDYLPK